MKRKNITSYVFVDELTDKIRPSQLDKFKANLHNSKIWNFKDLCSISEERFRQFPYVTDEIADDFNAYLSDYGLKLGMTEEELADYQDAEFFEKYPPNGKRASELIDDGACQNELIERLKKAMSTMDVASNTEIDDNIAEETIVLSSPLGSTSAKESEPEKAPFDPYKEKRLANAYIRDYDPVRFSRNDMEWYLHYARLDMLREQPWYIKAFVPFKYRVEMAFEKADVIFDKYQKDAVSRSVAYRKMHYDGMFKELLDQEH